MLKTRRAILAIGLSFALLGGGSPAAATEDVTVFAAASLKNALDEIAVAWTEKSGGKAVISYAGTSSLARQIEVGAPADVFFSADLDWMDYVAERKLIREESRSNLLQNRIVLIAPKDSEVAETEIDGNLPLADLLGKDGHLAMANTDAVPAGKYGKTALESLGLWTQVADRLAQAENVRSALRLVSIGGAPLGIVYRTDAAADPAVKVIGMFPEKSHPEIIYPVALLAGATSRSAEAFLEFVRTSPEARAAFEKQGFSMLPQPSS